MTDRHPRQRIRLEKQGELFPVKRTSLATPIQPFEQYPRRLHQEGLYRTGIEGHPIVLDVPAQLRAENRPNVAQRIPTTDRPAPGINRLQLGTQPFAVGFHLRQRCALPRSPPIKGKSQKIEDFRPGMAVPRSSKIDQPGLLLIQSQFVPGQPTAERFPHSLLAPVQNRGYLPLFWDAERTSYALLKKILRFLLKDF